MAEREILEEIQASIQHQPPNTDHRLSAEAILPPDSPIPGLAFCGGALYWFPEEGRTATIGSSQEGSESCGSASFYFTS